MLCFRVHLKQAYEAAVAAASPGEAAPGSSTVTGLQMEDPSALQSPGTKAGQTIVVSEQGVAVAYSWDASGCVACVSGARHFFGPA